MVNPRFAPTTPERIARNESIFREANEEIRQRAETLQPVDAARVPFICECAAPTCYDVLLLTLDEYAAIRRNDRWFLNAVGHNEAAGPAAKVVAVCEGYEIAEKVGAAGEYAERLAGNAVND